MGKGIIVSWRTAVICVMLWAAVLPLRPLCAGVARDRYYETEGSCGPEDGVHWRITGDTLRIWGEGTMEDDWGSAWDMRKPCIAAEVRHVVIEEGVTDVADRLMEDVGTVESVRLPKGLGRIGGGAFEGCGLKGELVLPEGLEQIGNYAFSDCDNIVSVWLPGSVWNMGYDAFFGCRAMRRVEIGEGMKSIDLEDVLDGTGVTEIYVPASMEDIDFSEIKKRGRRVEIVLARGNRRYREMNGMVYDMRDSAVVDCDTMKCGKVVLPEWVRRVGDYAFYRCGRITEVEMPGVREIGVAAFSGCKGLKRVVMGDEVKMIGWSAFSGCAAIEEMNVPVGVEHIGPYSFFGCESWRGEVVLSMKCVPSAFEKRVPACAFVGCRLLRSVEIEECVEAIGHHAFAGCVSLKEIVLPESVKRIEYDAFSGCSGVRRMVLPKGDVKMDGAAFVGMTGLEEVETGDSMMWSGGALYDMRDSTLLVYTRGGDVRLPEWVRRIGNSAFEDNDGLTGIEIPDGVRGIGMKAFAGCDSLREVNIRGKMYIGDEAFAGCKGIERVSVSGEIIGCVSMFERCVRLREAEVDCENVNLWMFQNCGALEKVRLSGRVKSIGKEAFEECVSLMGIELPEGLLSIKDEAFAGCTGLRKVVLPPCMVYVYEGAFAGCTGLGSIETADGECTEEVDVVRNREHLGPKGVMSWRASDRLSIEENTELVWEYMTHDGVLYRRNGGKLMADVIPEGKTGTWELPAADSVEVSTELFKQAVRQFSRIRCTGSIVPETRTYRYSYPDGNPDRVSGCVLEVPQGTRKEFEREEIDGMVNWWSLFDEIEEM